MIPDQSVVYYEGTWPATTFTKSVDEYVNAVVTDLAGRGLVSRGAPSYSIGALGAFEPFDIKLTLQVENGLGYAQPDDVISIIRNSVYQTVGAFPLADTIPNIQAPGQTSPTPTGQPAVAVTALPGCIAGTSNDLAGNFSFSCWFENLTTKGLGTIGLLAIGLVLGIVLILEGSRRAAHAT